MPKEDLAVLDTGVELPTREGADGAPWGTSRAVGIDHVMVVLGRVNDERS
ncbi:hypothetical protein [Streptomyces mobaraensis]